MSDSNSNSLEYLFHPRSIALVGITTANPGHWTRTFLDSLIAFQFEGPIYLVNPKGGEINGLKVHQSLRDIPNNIDYVIGLVPARESPRLVEECAGKGVRAIHFCTAGFSETGEDEPIRLEAEVVRLARKHRIRIIGPNCMGIYSPKSRLSFMPAFPKESGPVGAISQSGGNANYIVRLGAQRGVRFSKVISYGNACDYNESDFLDYLATDPDTKIIGMYVEGLRDGEKFRRALEKATREKPVILLKGGLTDGGARAAAGHTASLAGSKATWEALARQLGVIFVETLDEMIDVMVTLLFMSVPKGRNAVVIGSGGGASVLITDEFERKGLKVPQLPKEIIREIRQFIPAAGNILRNPVDLSQNMTESDSVRRAVTLASQWDGIDFLVKFLRTGQVPQPHIFKEHLTRMMEGFSVENGGSSKPSVIVVDPSIVPEEASIVYDFIQQCLSSGLPVYYSFGSAANAINEVLSYYESRQRRLGT
ncbi:MAG: CoA-binding protein [Chloroflexi bacterium]|nr:CoA-binding protein [Chloroflexota bacterium]